MWFLITILLSTTCLATPNNGDTFLAFGDWGGQSNAPFTTPAQVSVASAMNTVAQREQAQFVLALGDNFYNDGVPDVRSQRFRVTFEDVYAGKALNVPWHVLAGNHDHRENVTAQVAYSDWSQRWNFPSPYYTFTKMMSGNLTVQFVFIDTVLLAGSWDFHEPQPLFDMELSAANEQWKWIVATIKKSVADYLIVAGHYPVWSAAEHGSTNELVKKLNPLLQQYGVAAYFCGHEHNLQHIRTGGVDYALVGGGHGVEHNLDHKNSVPKGSLQFYYPPQHYPTNAGGFASVEIVNKATMITTFYDHTGANLYSLNTTNPRYHA